MSEPTVDYWRAKAQLCRDLALIQIEDEKTEKEAGMNLMRMVHALSMVDAFNVGCCDKCNSWDDCLESGVCQTCIKEGEGNDN